MLNISFCSRAHMDREVLQCPSWGKEQIWCKTTQTVSCRTGRKMTLSDWAVRLYAAWILSQMFSTAGHPSVNTVRPFRATGLGSKSGVHLLWCDTREVLTAAVFSLFCQSCWSLSLHLKNTPHSLSHSAAVGFPSLCGTYYQTLHVCQPVNTDATWTVFPLEAS